MEFPCLQGTGTKSLYNCIITAQIVSWNSREEKVTYLENHEKFAIHWLGLKGVDEQG